MASARRGRRHPRLQFPRRGLVLERALAAVCGDATVWKPSDKTPLTAIAVTRIAERVCRETGADPAIFTLLIGDRKQSANRSRRSAHAARLGDRLDAMGIEVAKSVHGRLGRTMLELGGNNAIIVAPSADLDLAAQSILFGAVGTAGQRCTSTRRVIVHESVADKVREKLLRRLQVDAASAIRSTRHPDGTADRSARGRRRAGSDRAD